MSRTGRAMGGSRRGCRYAILCLALSVVAVRGEVILQYFNTSWNEIAARMPELAEAGYTALWLPPPFKAGSQYSVGFDTFDRFDLGDKDQMGGVPTRYGTKSDLLNMVETAHRFGIRVYFDNVMAHNGGPVPGYDENTSIYAQPGFVPEDFHLLTRADGTYRKRPSDWPDWGDEWQILNRNPFGLDTALEWPVNANHGPYEGATFPKYCGVRQADHPEWYLDTDLPVATNGGGGAVYTFANKEPFSDVGYGPGNTGAGNGRFDWDDTNSNGQHDAGETSEPFTDTGIDPTVSDRRTVQWGYGDGKYNMGNPTAEYVNGLMERAIRWFVDQSRCDGFRLDAVRHVPNYFFGATYGGDKDYSGYGYCGQVNEQFNVTRGFNDWGNHRDTCFNDRLPRNDALFYGETLGEPPAWSGYCDAGMRIAHDGVMNRVGNSIGYSLSGMDSPGDGSYGVDTGMMYLMSHDQAWLYEGHFKLGHALILARAGLPIIYTDGFHHSGPPNWFPKWSTVPFLGQWDQLYMLNELDIHRNFARGDQYGLWSDGDLCAFERRDYRETANDWDAVVLLFVMARGWTSGQGISRINATAFPANAYLYNYSMDGGGFYVRVGEDKKIYDLGWNEVIVPSGGYFAFSWRSPEQSTLWSGFGGTPITIYENGAQCELVGVVRTDGEGGDADFNPYNVADTNASDYSYTYYIPRVTVATNLRFAARVDGSAANVLMKLDAGVDINGNGSRDNGPDIWENNAGTEMFCGYEQPAEKTRQYPEKFASVDSARNKIGSAGAETYVATIGTPGFTYNAGDGVNDWDNTYTASWVWHDPTNFINAVGYPTTNRHWSVDAGGTNTLWVKMGNGCNANRMYLYYTTDGTSWPEGAGGEGWQNTKVVELNFAAVDQSDANHDWWNAALPAMSNGTPFRWKVGACKMQGTNHACGVAEDIPYPNSWNDITRKTAMMAVYEITNFNAETVSYYPHNDYGFQETNGLKEGLHCLSARAFLQRANQASIYNTFVQTFYMDATTPGGAIIYPASDGDTLWGSSYGCVVRGDRTVKEAWYRITDSQTNNDDSATGVANGNAAWVPAVQVSANPTIASPYPNEWRFDYVNIPPSNSATIEVRLREISSSTNMTLDDTPGHFTTLTRTVQTRGPDVRLFIAWPPVDGQVVGPGYVLKADFSKLLADGISSNDLINCFTLKINSNTQARTAYNIVYNETPDYHALAFELPNVYDGFPDHQHLIEVSLDRDPYPLLTAYRRIRSQPVETPYVDFVAPPVLDASGQPFEIVLPDVAAPTQTQREYTVQVETASTALDVNVYFTLGTGTLTEVGGNPGTNGNYKTWDFLWSFPVTNNPALIDGQFQLRADVDTDGDWGDVEAYVVRDTRVVLREMVAGSTNDVDDDDDGLPDYDEVTAHELPAPPSSSWNNGDVHIWYIFGKTDPLSPDSDGDGLPDGLELGWRNPGSNTATDVDTDGDGFMNFLSDLDPPFYNTADNFDKVPGVSLPDYGNKTELKAGTATDPNNPDSDYDGLPDGVEDANRNGWVDGDGAIIEPDWDPWLERDWPDRSLDTSDTWLETDPNNSDTDQDGLSDGYGEDKNFNGRIDGDANSNRVYDAGEEWTETDPLNRDTDGDSLPDGWEVNYALDPLDDGSSSLRTAAADDGSITNGAAGDPDNDGTPNLNELINGTNPRWPDTGEPPPEGSIVIGTGVAVTVGIVLNNNEFTDWSYEDLVALDPCDLYEQSNGGDVYYRWWESDGLDSSRDLVAFYARDGGATNSGGDGNFYFRVDLHQLQAHAEDSGLDIYVVIDTGNQQVGERKLVDYVDCLTDMRWEATVAVYDGNNGTVYVNKPGSWDTSTLEDEIVISPDDVDARTKAHPEGFRAACFNHELDAVEFAVSRQALVDAGWNGNIASLNFQVFTTRDGTGNDPRGPGDLDGPDIQDSIRTDWITEDFAGITDGDVGRLRYEGRIALTTLIQWVGINADNDRGKRIKVIPLVHGSQQIQPGSVIQDLVNNGAGAGYYRPFDVHEAFGVPLTLHVTPTLASAIQWAKVDTNAGPAWRDGPALNARIATLIATGIVDLVASTFSDHMLPYFTKAFNSNNVGLATEFLEDIYGSGAVSEKIFWTPERLADADVFDKIADLGFTHTFVDQSQHIRRWFDFGEAVGENGYRINVINGVGCFVINDRFHDLRFSSLDSGPDLLLREVLNRRARTGYWGDQHPQVLVLEMDWEEFGDLSDANAYDDNIRWMASRGWIQIVSPDQIVNGEIDISLPADGSGDTWNTVNRGTSYDLSKTGHDWIQYSAQENYDHWYVGDGLNQGLQHHVFEIRSGTNVPDEYGMLYYGGVASDAWDIVEALPEPEGPLGKLARGVLHASVFKTAYHNQSENPVNMTKFSVGTFTDPDDVWDGLSDFARYAQSQTRMAAVYDRVDQWAAAPPSSSATANEDIDLDGEDEYLLYNARLFCLFERMGARMVAAWVRDLVGDQPHQVVGNLLSYSGADSEWQGNFRVDTNRVIGAYRMACFSDWWATKGGGTAQYVNDLYAFTDWTNGWRALSSDGCIQKTITLGDTDGRLEADYEFFNEMAGQTLYVRHGLSPNLYDLLLRGQAGLGSENHGAGVMTLAQSNYTETVVATLGYADGGHDAGFKADAVDDDPGNGVDFHTMRMRNLAQTHQVELVGTNALSFSLAFQAKPSDWDGDGIPNTYEDDYDFLDPANGSDGSGDYDTDGSPNHDEYVAGTPPDDQGVYPKVGSVDGDLPSGITIRFDTVAGRNHYVWYANSAIMNPDWLLATTNPIPGTGGIVEWTDDGSQTDPNPGSGSVTGRFYRVEFEVQE